VVPWNGLDRILSPYRPVRSKSLYQVSYPSPQPQLDVTTLRDCTLAQCIFDRNALVTGHKQGRSALLNVNRCQDQLQTPESLSVLKFVCCTS